MKFDSKGREIVRFFAPFHISLRRTLKNGEYKTRLRFDQLSRLAKWIYNVFFVREEVRRAIYEVRKEGYYGITDDGEFGRLIPPSIDEQTQVLQAPMIAISNEVDDDFTEVVMTAR